jgi:hypothetical protein
MKWGGAALSKTMTTKFASIVSSGGAATMTSLSMTQPESHCYASTSTSADLTLSSVVFSKDSHLHLMGPTGDTVTLTAVTGPSSGKGYIHVQRADATFSANPSDKFVIVSDFPAGTGSTLTFVAGALAAELDVKATTILETLTSLAGKITGAGSLTPGDVTAITSDVSKFEGTLITSGDLTLDKPLAKGTLEMAGTHTVTVSTAGAMKLVRPSVAGGIIIADENLTIAELDLRQFGITLAPASGKTITVKRITAGSDGLLTVGAGTNLGMVKIVNGETSGGVSIFSSAMLQ